MTLWARDPGRVGESARPGITRACPACCPKRSSPRHPCPCADAVLLAVPTQHLRAVLPRLPPGLAPLLVCAKGVERDAAPAAGNHRGLRPGPRPCSPARTSRTRSPPACPPPPWLRPATPACAGRSPPCWHTSFRLYGNDDPIGAQVGGAAKNVIAIAAGAVIGAGLGENARAALITRGLAELARLAVALGGRAETVMGLSGLGDLLLTCTGPSSRNFSLGLALGRGERLADVLAARSAVTEGVATAPALVAAPLPVARGTRGPADLRRGGLAAGRTHDAGRGDRRAAGTTAAGRMIRGVLTVGGWTMASRILGFARDMLIAAMLGAGPIADAFFVALKLPNLFRRLFGEGAFNAAFVPAFSGMLAAEGRRRRDSSPRRRSPSWRSGSAR